MKNKFSLFIAIIFLSFCFIVFYKGLSKPNTYIPKIMSKKNIPIFEVKDFNSNAYLNSEKLVTKNRIINIFKIFI